MTPSSARQRSASTVSSVASRNQAGASRNAPVRVKVLDRVARLRTTMVNAAPVGFQSRVANLMEWRRQRPTREVTGVEKLSVELVLAEIAVHREEGRGSAADEILALVNEGQAIRLAADRGVTIRMSGGQLLLDFEAPKENP